MHMLETRGCDYREQDGCWNCDAMEDVAGLDDCSSLICSHTKCRKTRWSKCPSVSPGGKCKYHYPEAG